MAIFSKTQFPKYQSPIRITRPYIKPNYLADTINSAIQGYGSIQGMNMQQQLFNAKLKAAQDAKAQNELDQATQRQYLMGVDAGAQPARTDIMNLQGGDPYGIAGIPAYSQGALNQTYQYDTPAVPGASSMDSLRAAMQANPNADPIQLMRVAQAYSALQPKPAKGMSAAMAYRMGRDAKGDAATATAADAKAGKAFNALVSQVLGKGIGGYGSGDIADYMVMDPETNQLVQSKDPLANLAGSFPHGLNQTTTEYIDPKTGEPIPSRWFGDSGPHTVTTAGDNPYYKTGGQLGFQEFTQAELRPWVARMLKSGVSPEQAALNVAKAIRGGRAQPGTASGAFNYNKATEAVRIMQGNESEGSVEQRAANLGIS
jgi:hypothetical protein